MRINITDTSGEKKISENVTFHLKFTGKDGRGKKKISQTCDCGFSFGPCLRWSKSPNHKLLISSGISATIFSLRGALRETHIRNRKCHRLVTTNVGSVQSQERAAVPTFPCENVVVFFAKCFSFTFGTV